MVGLRKLNCGIMLFNAWIYYYFIAPGNLIIRLAFNTGNVSASHRYND